MLTKFLIKIGSFLAIMTYLIFYGYYFSDPADKFLFFIISLTAIFAFGVSAILLVRHMLLEIKKFTKNTDAISDEIRADPRWQEVEDYMDWPDRE